MERAELVLFEHQIEGVAEVDRPSGGIERLLPVIAEGEGRRQVMPGAGDGRSALAELARPGRRLVAFAGLRAHQGVVDPQAQVGRILVDPGAQQVARPPELLARFLGPPGALQEVAEVAVQDGAVGASRTASR